MSTSPQPEYEALPTRTVFRCSLAANRVTGADRTFKTEARARAYFDQMCCRYPDVRIWLRHLHETKRGYWWIPDFDHPETYTIAEQKP